MKIKCGHREFEVDHTDEILDNGSCYQLITQNYYHGYCRLFPKIAKTTFMKLLKEDMIYKAREYKPSHYIGSKQMWIYKFKENTDNEWHGTKTFTYGEKEN